MDSSKRRPSLSQATRVGGPTSQLHAACRAHSCRLNSDSLARGVCVGPSAREHAPGRWGSCGRLARTLTSSYARSALLLEQAICLAPSGAMVGARRRSRPMPPLPDQHGHRRRRKTSPPVRRRGHFSALPTNMPSLLHPCLRGSAPLPAARGQRRMHRRWRRRRKARRVRTRRHAEFLTPLSA